MDFRPIILHCYLDKNNWAKPKAYFEWQFKKAEKTELCTVEYFFNGCQNILQSFKEQIRLSYEQQMEHFKKQIDYYRGGKGLFLPPRFADKRFSASHYGEEYQKSERKKALEGAEAHLKTFSIEKVILNVLEPITLNDIAIIETGLNDAVEYLKKEKVINDSKGELTLQQLFKTESWKIFNDLLDEIDLTIAGKPNPDIKKGRAGKFAAVIDAVKETPGMLKVDKPTGELLRQPLNEYLRTDYKSLSKRNEDYPETLPIAKAFLARQLKATKK